MLSRRALGTSRATLGHAPVLLWCRFVLPFKAHGCGGLRPDRRSELTESLWTQWFVAALLFCALACGLLVDC
jgi:hypothetical protein